tara:strand:- start:227 stop:469 length:243 start_codon:yes stop_codon:yes gene_type:complete
VTPLTFEEFYLIIDYSNLQENFLMPVSYANATKSKYRVTLDLEVQEDFNPHNIDWEKVLNVQGNEKINSYVEDLSTPDVW